MRPVLPTVSQKSRSVNRAPPELPLSEPGAMSIPPPVPSQPADPQWSMRFPTRRPVRCFVASCQKPEDVSLPGSLPQLYKQVHPSASTSRVICVLLLTGFNALLLAGGLMGLEGYAWAQWADHAHSLFPVPRIIGWRAKQRVNPGHQAIGFRCGRASSSADLRASKVRVQ